MSELSPEVLKHLYSWLDSIPFSKPRGKRLARDFADASRVVELLNYFHPKIVQEHNAYPSCMAMAAKIDNWERLNRKVLGRLGIRLTKDQIRDLAAARLRTTEAFLCQLAALIYKKNERAIHRTLKKLGSEVDLESCSSCESASDLRSLLCDSEC